MRSVREFVVSALIGGLLVLLPAYLSILVLLKGIKSVTALAHPIALLPPKWLPVPELVSILGLLVAAFVVGACCAPGRAGRFGSDWSSRCSDECAATACSAASRSAWRAGAAGTSGSRRRRSRLTD